MNALFVATTTPQKPNVFFLKGAQVANNVQPRPATAYRVEKALNLLTYWAWQRYAMRNRIETSSGYTSESVLCSFSGGKEYKPFCFKLKTNAKETRVACKSKEPIGGGGGWHNKHEQAARVNKLLIERFSDRAYLLLYALFLPAEGHGTHGTLSAAKIARLAGFKPARASQIKNEAVQLIVKQMLSPIEA